MDGFVAASGAPLVVAMTVLAALTLRTASAARPGEPGPQERRRRRQLARRRRGCGAGPHLASESCMSPALLCRLARGTTNKSKAFTSKPLLHPRFQLVPDAQVGCVGPRLCVSEPWPAPSRRQRHRSSVGPDGAYADTGLPGHGKEGVVLPVILPVITEVILPAVNYRGSHNCHCRFFPQGRSCHRWRAEKASLRRV